MGTGGCARQPALIRPWQSVEEDGYEWTAPVGSFPPNGFGLYDAWRRTSTAPLVTWVSVVLSSCRPDTVVQFFLPPSCNACKAFSTLSEPETWLGG